MTNIFISLTEHEFCYANLISNVKLEINFYMGVESIGMLKE
jgi:hypothetical protein